MVKIKSIFVQTLKKEANAHFSFKWFFFVCNQQTLSNVSPFLVAINANTRSKVKPSDMSSTYTHVLYPHTDNSVHQAKCSCGEREREHANNFNVQNIDRAARTHFSLGAKEKRWAKTIKITVTHSPLLAIYFATSKKFSDGFKFGVSVW